MDFGIPVRPWATTLTSKCHGMPLIIETRHNLWLTTETSGSPASILFWLHFVMLWSEWSFWVWHVMSTVFYDVCVHPWGWGVTDYMQSVTCNLITNKSVTVISYVTSKNIVIRLQILLRNWMITYWIILKFRKEFCKNNKMIAFCFLNDIQFSNEKGCKFKFVPPERVWPQVRDHYDNTPNAFDGSFLSSSNAS